MNDDSVLECKALVAGNCCNTRTRVDYCSYLWIIHNYYEYHYYCKEYMNSSQFKSSTNDKYVWSLQLSPPNDEMAVCGSLFLLTKNEELCTNVAVKCKMSVINGERRETNVRKQTHFEKLMKFESGESSNPCNYYYTSFPNFINGNDFAKFLKGDILTIYCEVHFIANKHVTINDTAGLSVVIPYQINSTTLHEDLGRLLESEDFSDFTISVDGKKYQVHKNILAARSKVFDSMLKHEMRERHQNCMEITDIDPPIFEEMLRYMYTGKIRNLKTVSFGLLSAADKYDLTHLKMMCEYSLIKKLSVENAVDALILADLHHTPLLKFQAIEYIKFHIEAVKKTETWFKIEQSNLLKEIFNALFP